MRGENKRAVDLLFRSLGPGVKTRCRYILYCSKPNLTSNEYNSSVNLHLKK